MTLAVDATAEIFFAENYANALLRELGMSARATCAAIHPALRAAESGLLALTGRDDGLAQMCPTPLAACADGAIAALRALAPAAPLAALDGGALLGERAAAFGHVRAGSISAGGSCRLLRAGDDWVAVNLARDADWELLPAWLESECTRDWKSLAAALCEIPVAAAVARGRLLGLPVAPLTPHEPEATTWLQRRAIAAGNKNNKSQRGTAPLVIDLSSLWAGPLCGHLLHVIGARVVKVESLQRPDGARAGPSHFFDLINAGKQSVALDLSAPAGREQLQQLLLRADIVIEASRPRALRQMDIVAEDVLAQNPALTWVSITGYGREEPGLLGRVWRRRGRGGGAFAAAVRGDGRGDVLRRCHRRSIDRYTCRARRLGRLSARRRRIAVAIAARRDGALRRVRQRGRPRFLSRALSRLESSVR